MRRGTRNCYSHRKETAAQKRGKRPAQCTTDSRRRSRRLPTTSSATGERARRQNARPQPPRRVVIISTWSATTRINCRSAFTPRPPQRLRRQWPLRARAAAVAPPTNNYPERFAGPAQNLPAVPAQATTRPPKDARRTYLEGAQINHGSGPAPRPARRLRPLRIATARHGEHRVRVHAANIGTGGSRSRGNLRATPVMVIKADAGRIPFDQANSGSRQMW